METSTHRLKRRSRTDGACGSRGPALTRVAAVALLAALLGVVSLGLHRASAACSVGKSADGICAVFEAGSVREGSSLSFTVPIPEEWTRLAVYGASGGEQVSFDNHTHARVHATYGIELSENVDGEIVYASKCSVRSVVILDDNTWGEENERGEHPDISRITTSGRRITVTTRQGIWSESRDPLQIHYELHGRRTNRTVLNSRVTSSSTEDCILTGRSSGHGNPIVGTAVAEITITRNTSSSASNPALTLAREHRPGTQRSNAHTPGADILPNTSRCTVVDFGSSQMSWCGTMTTDGVEYAPTGERYTELCVRPNVTCTRH